MRLVFVVCESGVDGHVIEIIRALGAPGYTRFTGAIGEGQHGRREGTPVWPGLNSLVMVALPEDLVEGLLQGLAKLREDRGGRLAIKAFSVPAEESL